MAEHRGGCHCGAIAFVFETALAPEEVQPRACQCTFCRKHGVLAASDPGGRVTITVRDEVLLNRYRFGHGTADFYLCARCGACAAAVMADGDAFLSVINVNCLDARERFSRAPAAMDFGAEEEGGRLQRRRAAWTPTEVIV